MEKEFDYKALSQNLLSIEVIKRLLLLQGTKGRVEALQQVKEPLFNTLIGKTIVNDVVFSPIASCSETMVNNYLIKSYSPEKIKSRGVINYYNLLKKGTLYKDKYKKIISKEDIINLYSSLLEGIEWTKESTLKTKDNNIRVYYRGKIKNTLRTVEVKDVEKYLVKICKSFNYAIKDSQGYEIVIISLFIVDFMYAYPFEYYNEAIIKVLIQVLLYRCGYNIVKYVSVQEIIKGVEHRFNEILKNSLDNRMNPYLKVEDIYDGFLKLLIPIVDSAYEDLDYIVNNVPQKGIKAKRIKSLFGKKNESGKYLYWTKKDIISICPDISKRTVERTLNQLLKANYIIKIGYTTNTHYQKKEKK
jgi:Fic family protein